MMNKQHHVSLHPPIGGSLPGRYSPPYRSDPMRRHCMNPPPGNQNSYSPTFWKSSGLLHQSLHHPDDVQKGNLFGGLDESLLSRAEALAAVDISKSSSLHMKHHDGMYPHPANMGAHPGGRPQMSHHGMHHDTMDLLDMSALPASSMGIVSSMGTTDHHNVASPHNPHHGSMYHHHGMQASHHGLNPHNMSIHPDQDADPRELEAFAERFKQRRIKLGVTQADVGNALANLKLPGVGSLSQSTICRFESLTLSHNNMVALKPILQAWLEDAEAKARKGEIPDQSGKVGDKKRKRTSIAAPEKRSLEAYFAVQPRPSGEKIAAIAEKLDLKKNVVRVWFCNQRQKQKRMKFSAQH
ncbi:PREDICTED: POU domain, class 4, transcription factor 3-like [Priapulus caudatus]|uniref:POU domain protein n=1 Tax=Priapulus caudatus TaxID=37621 RepID=A0ABM1EH75_PRICU|nr:PREDICTED: POU domain, class 4, transcription factor 3-like [Priapulus caudatus]